MEIGKTLKTVSANAFDSLALNSFSMETLGTILSNGTANLISGISTSGMSEISAKKINDGITTFLKQVDTSQFAGQAGGKINDGVHAFFNRANMTDAGTRLGEEFKESLKGFSKEASKGINEGIRNTLGPAASAASWSVLPYVAVAVVVSTALPLTLHYIYHRTKHYIGSPKLTTKIHQHTVITPLIEQIGKVYYSFAPKSPEAKPIYNAELTRRITDLTNSVKNIRQNGGYFQNVLFYGPGGTGKTMISECIAKNSGMSYVKMSGGDLAQYIKRGEHVTELNKLLDKMELSWRPWSSRPWILFIDEAESFCRDRSKIPSTKLLELQNAFLNRTGTQSKNFMLILATNRMEDLDEALLSRMDHKILIGPPAEKERADIIASYVPQFFSSSEQSKFFTATQVAKMAKNTDGLTGRAIFKLLNTVAGKKAATDNCKLTQEMIDITIKDVIAQEAEVAKRRAQKEQTESRRPPTLMRTSSAVRAG